MKKRTLITIVILVLLGKSASYAQDLYKVSLVRAAPGDLLELIDVYKVQAEKQAENSEFRPLILRHSQGDNWDLMIVEYVQNYKDHFSDDRKSAGSYVPAYSKAGSELIAYHEEMFVRGPSYPDYIEKVNANKYFHVEMFISLPEKQVELYKEREMENAFLNILGRPENFIFTRDFGARWDMFTLGAYRDLTHYAESALIPEDKEEEAAVEAGFESVGTIGSYLRSLILEHHDTLASKVF